MSPFTRMSDQEKLEMRRFRKEISCAECKRLKLKCDRQIPCASCVRRKCQAICPYGTLSSTSYRGRLIASDTSDLHSFIDKMGERISVLENALSEAEPNNPLLRENLLRVKFPLAPHNPLLDIQNQSTDTDLINAMGSMTLGVSGESKYLGPNAKTETLLMANSSPEGDALPIAARDIHPDQSADATNFYPLQSFLSSPFKDRTHFLDHLLHFLPVCARAEVICSAFVDWTLFTGRLVSKTEIFRDFLFPVYEHYEGKSRQQPRPEQVAVLYLALSIGIFIDVSIPPHSVEADWYYNLGRAALTLCPVMESPNLDSVLAVALMCLYHAQGGSRTLKYTESMDCAWNLAALSMKLAQMMGLHRESADWNLPSEISERRRTIFWELFCMDAYLSNFLGRPPSIQLNDVDVPFPHDHDQIVEDGKEPKVGHHRFKYEFTKEIYFRVLEITQAAKLPDYSAVMDLDRLLRQKKTPYHLWLPAELGYAPPEVIPEVNADDLDYSQYIGKCDQPIYPSFRLPKAE